MLRDLLKEGGLYTVANLLTHGVSLILIPFYTAYFSPSDYGIIGMITVFGTFFNAIVSLQLNQGLARYVGDGAIDESAKGRYGATAIYFTIFIYIVTGILVFLGDRFFVDLLSSDVRIPEHIFDLAIISIVINGVFYIQGVYFRFLRKTKTYAILTFFHAISNILLTLIFVLGLDFGIAGIFIAANIVAPVMVIVQSAILWKHLRPYIGFPELKVLLKFSIPLIPVGISYAVLGFTDRLFIKEYLNSSAQIGIYDIGYKFGSIVTLIIAGFSMAITPLIYEKHHLESTGTELARIAKIFFSLGTLGALTVGIFSLETLQVFISNEEYHAAALVMPILYTTVLFTGVWMFSPGLNIQKRTTTIAYVVIISSLLNVALNFLLTPTFHLVGCAFSALLSVGFNNITLYYLANKHYPINLPYLKIGGMFLVFCTLVFVGGYGIYYFELAWWANVLIKLTIIGLYFLLIIRTGLFDLSYFQKLKSLLTHAKK